MTCSATTTDPDRLRFLASLIYGIESRHMNPANQVDWIAMRAALTEQQWRNYVLLLREHRELSKIGQTK